MPWWTSSSRRSMVRNLLTWHEAPLCMVPVCHLLQVVLMRLDLACKVCMRGGCSAGFRLGHVPWGTWSYLAMLVH